MGEVETIEEQCRDCGSDEIVHSGGCKHCKNCGWSKCLW